MGGVFQLFWREGGEFQDGPKPGHPQAFWAPDQRHPLLRGKDLAVSGAPWASSALSFDLKVKSNKTTLTAS